jgi:hypothetical protein
MAAVLLFLLVAANGVQGSFGHFGKSPVEVEKTESGESSEGESLFSRENHPDAKNWEKGGDPDSSFPAFAASDLLALHFDPLYWSSLYGSRGTSCTAASRAALYGANFPPLYLFYCAFVGDIEQA